MLIDIVFYCILGVIYLIDELSRLILPIMATYFFIHSNITLGFICCSAFFLISIIVEVINKSLDNSI